MKDQLKNWKIADLSVLATFESARQLGLFDSFHWTDEQFLHAMELLMAVYILARAAYDRRKAVTADAT